MKAAVLSKGEAPFVGLPVTAAGLRTLWRPGIAYVATAQARQKPAHLNCHSLSYQEFRKASLLSLSQEGAGRCSRARGRVGGPRVQATSHSWASGCLTLGWVDYTCGFQDELAFGNHGRMASHLDWVCFPSDQRPARQHVAWQPRHLPSSSGSARASFCSLGQATAPLWVLCSLICPVKDWTG